jgi:hypothetical protein
MSVNIQLLDYKFQEEESPKPNGLLANYSFTSSSGWTLGNGWTIAGGQATHATGSDGNLINTAITLVQGGTYRINYKISNSNGNGYLNLQNHVDGAVTNLALSVANGAHTFDWIQGANNLDQLNILATNDFGGNIEFVKIFEINGINWERSIVGELDVTDHSEFPLALTFQISEFKDITSTTGDYSKSFKVPATKNNNKIFKHIYIPNIDEKNNPPTENMPCRVLVDNLFSLIGSLKVTGMGGYGEQPSYYDCVFYGNNLGWANGIDRKYLNDINWGTAGENLTYKKTSIETTWNDVDCDSSTSPIVYPITSYGAYNLNGNNATIQLLKTNYEEFGGSSSKVGYYGFWDNGDDYGTPPPVADWRPAIFVKDTLERIFAQSNGLAGYTINSTFMNTDTFKRLVWLLPNFKYNNPDERFDDYSFQSQFTNERTLNVAQYPSSGTPLPNTPAFSEDGVWRFYQSAIRGADTPTGAGTNYYSGSGREEIDLDTVTSDASSYNLTVNLDNGSYLDTTNNYITIGEYGYYTIRLDGLESKLARIFHTSATPQVVVAECKSTVNLEVKTVGHTSWNIIEMAEVTMTPVSANINSSNPGVYLGNPFITEYAEVPAIVLKRYFNKGDRIRLTKGMQISNVGNGAINFQMYVFWKCNSNANFNIEIDPRYVEYGQTYNLKDVINPDYKQVDFIKGVSHAFNLTMTTDETTKTVNIDPVNTFYQGLGNAIDWTYKLDRSREIQDKFLKSDLKRNIVFKYKEDDKDGKVARMGDDYFDNIPDTYPYQEILPSKFQKGDSEFENPFFAGTYNAKDRRTTNYFPFDTAFSACLWRSASSSTSIARAGKGYEFQPRLLYWNKYSPTISNNQTLFTHKKAFVQLWQHHEIIRAANNSIIDFKIYPQATSYNQDDSSSPVLTYGNVWIKDYDDATGVYAAKTVGKGLYDTYYKNTFEMIKSNPRLRTAYIDLKINDIVNLDFRKLVYIDGCYWRINKIVDYMPNKNTPTKVELVEWIDVGTFDASAPSVGSSYSSTIGNIDFDDSPMDEDDSNTNMGL